MSEDAGRGARFVGIDRLNSVLVITSVEETFREVERWLSRLDQPVSNTGMRNYVYKVRNSKAIDIERVLGQLYSGTFVAGPSSPQDFAGLAGLTTGAAPVASTLGTLLTDSTVFGGQQQFGENDMRIIADEVTNSLIVRATEQDYEEIRQTIEELDILPRQVLVDAQIYEVTPDDSLSFGLTAALQNRGTLANSQTTASFGGSPASLSAQTFSFIGRTRELVLFLNASENRSRVRTVSAAAVLVSDNMTAQFHIGAEIPIPTSTALNPAAGSAELFYFAQTIQFRTTGVILNVRPQINDSGRVTLEIVQEVSQAGENTTSAIVAPVIGKSSISSTIVVQDGQTIALGSFIRESQERASSRIPILGRIPGLGVLFGSTRTATTRTELVILITPHVIRDFDTAAEATEELMSRLEEVQTLLNE